MSSLNNNTEQYYLLNKDRIITSFEIETDADTGESTIIETEDNLPETRMFDKGLEYWLLSRRAPSNRKYIAGLLRRYNCDTIEGYVKLTHALSLNDTYWVKEVDSRLSWEDVSLYTNEFSEVIAQAAFTGLGYDITNLNSPEFTTSGMYPKCWVRKNNEIYLYKTGLKGFEPNAECYASIVAEAICKNSVHYDLISYKAKQTSSCKLFTNEDLGFRPFGIISDSRKLKDILNTGIKYNCEDEIRRMIVLDALIANVDRHVANFGFLVNNDSEQVVKFAPVFDFNCAFFSSDWSESIILREYYNTNAVPKIGVDFITAAKYVLNNDVRNDLMNLRYFEFNRYFTEESDAKLLSQFVREQVNLILGDKI